MGFAPGPPPGSKAPWTPIYYGRIRSLRVALLLAYGRIRSLRVALLLAYGRIRSLRLAQPLVASRSELKLQVDLPTSVSLSPSPFGEGRATADGWAAHRSFPNGQEEGRRGYATPPQLEARHWNHPLLLQGPAQAKGL